MQADFWLERWKLNQIGFHEEVTNRHLQEFWQGLAIPTTRKVFVPLCGKSRDMLWLRSQGYQVLGVELSLLAVKSFFAENNLVAEVTEQGNFQRWEADGLVILQGNFFDLSAADLSGCCAIFDRAALIALPVDMRQKYVEHLGKISAVSADTLLITLEYKIDEMQGPPFSVTDKEVNDLFAKTHTIQCLHKEDVLAQNEPFIARGLSYLNETVYKLKKL